MPTATFGVKKGRVGLLGKATTRTFTLTAERQIAAPVFIDLHSLGRLHRGHRPRPGPSIERTCLGKPGDRLSYHKMDAMLCVRFQRSPMTEKGRVQPVANSAITSGASAGSNIGAMYAGLRRSTHARRSAHRIGKGSLALPIVAAVARLCVIMPLRKPPRIGPLSAEHAADLLEQPVLPFSHAHVAMSTWDVFISHASEDKKAFVQPLADALRDAGLKVWFDSATLRVGESLREAIDRGLSQSRYGVVVISPAFLVRSGRNES